MWLVAADLGVASAILAGRANVGGWRIGLAGFKSFGCATLAASVFCAFAVLVASPADAQVASPYASGFDRPASLTFDAAGALYASTADRAGNLSGVYRAPAGSGQVGVRYDTGNLFSQTHESVIGPDNALYIADVNANTIWRMAPGSTTPTSYATGTAPLSVQFDGAGNLYSVVGSGEILKVGPGGGALQPFATGADFGVSLAIDAAGSLFVPRYDDNDVVSVGPAGGAVAIVSAHGIPQVFSITVDRPTGDIYFVTQQGSPNGAIRVIRSGQSTSQLFLAGFDQPSALTYHNDALYVGEYNTGNVLRVVLRAPVPTLAEWAMIILGLMLAGGGAVILHRPWAVRVRA